MKKSKEEAYKEYITTLKEYIELIGDEMAELAIFAGIHGWKSTKYEEGKSLRKKLEELEKNV